MKKLKQAGSPTINAKKFPLQHVLWLGVLLILSPFASGLFLTVTFKTKLVPDTINAKKFLCTGKTQHVVRLGVLLILSPFATLVCPRGQCLAAVNTWSQLPLSILRSGDSTHKHRTLDCVPVKDSATSTMSGNAPVSSGLLPVSSSLRPTAHPIADSVCHSTRDSSIRRGEQAAEASLRVL